MHLAIGVYQQKYDKWDFFQDQLDLLCFFVTFPFEGSYFLCSENESTGAV